MTNGKQSLYFGVSDGYCYKINTSVFSDDGQPIGMKIRLPYDTGDGRRTTIKTFKNVVPFGEFPEAINVLYSTRNRKGTTDYKTQKAISDSTESVPLPMVKGTALSVGIDEISSHKVELEGLEIEYDVSAETI